MLSNFTPDQGVAGYRFDIDIYPTSAWHYFSLVQDSHELYKFALVTDLHSIHFLQKIKERNALGITLVRDPCVIEKAQVLVKGLPSCQLVIYLCSDYHCKNLICRDDSNPIKFPFLLPVVLTGHIVVLCGTVVHLSKGFKRADQQPICVLKVVNTVRTWSAERGQLPNLVVCEILM